MLMRAETESNERLLITIADDGEGQSPIAIADDGEGHEHGVNEIGRIVLRRSIWRCDVVWFFFSIFFFLGSSFLLQACSFLLDIINGTKFNFVTIFIYRVVKIIKILYIIFSYIHPPHKKKELGVENWANRAS